jgi:hypothetical protein
MPASTTLKPDSARPGRARAVGHSPARPLSVRNFMLVAMAIVMAAGVTLLVTLLVIPQASAHEVAGAFVPGALSEGAIGIAALGSLLVSSLVAGLLVRSRRPGRGHTGHDSPAA